MTSLTLLNENTFDDLYATTLHVDNIESNDNSEIAVDSIMDFNVVPQIQNVSLPNYVRQQISVTGALTYNNSNGVIKGIVLDNVNHDVTLSLSGDIILSADLASGSGQSLVLYLNYSQTVGSNKALSLTPTNTSQTILSTSIPGSTTSLIATFEILQSTLNQTFIPSGIFDISLFTAEDNANDGLEVYAELYKVSSLGVETLFATTDQLEVIQQYPNYGETTLSAVNVQQELLEVGGAFRMKIYGVNTRGSSHTLYTYYEGSGAGYSHMHTPFNTFLAGGYWDKSGNNVFLTTTGNLGVGTTTPLEKLQVSGNTLIDGLLSASGLSISNNSTFDQNLSISGLTVSNNTILNNNLIVSNNATFGQNLSVSGLTISQNFVVNNNFSVSNNVTFGQNLSVSGLTISQNFVVNNNFSVSNNVTFGQNLSVSGLTISQNFVVNNNFSVSNNVTFGQNLSVSGLMVSNNTILNSLTASFITATSIQSFTYNGFNITITGRDYTDTGGSIQGRFEAGYMPEGNYVTLVGTRGSAFPGVDGTSTVSFYSKNAIPTSSAYFSTRLTSQGGDPVAGIADGRFTIRSGSLQFQDNAGIRMITMTGGLSTSFNTNIHMSGNMTISGTLSVSNNVSIISGLSVTGNATFNTMTTNSLTGTNGRIITLSGTNIEYTLATFGNINITGQYSRLGLTLNASAPMSYSITSNRFSMSQVDDVGTDGYLTSAQYSALASSAIIWTQDGPNKNIYPTTNNRNLLLYNTDLSASPTVVDNGVNWRRTTLAGSLNHYMRMRTGGVKDGYLIHETQSSAPIQFCAGSLQPAMLLGGTFTDQIDANTCLHIKNFQNNNATKMKLEMSGTSSSSNICEIELQDPSNDISFRTAGNSENLIIRDNTRSINRLQITPTTLSHAGTVATLASSGNNRLDIGNAGNSGQFIDFNVGVSPANDFDARIICNVGTTGTNGAGNVDLWGNRFQFVMPSGAGARTVINSNGNLGVNFTPVSASDALTISGSFQLYSNGSGSGTDSFNFNRGRTSNATTGGDFLAAFNFNGRRQTDNTLNRGAYINCIQITSSTLSVASRIDIGARNSAGTEASVMSIEATGVAIGATLTAKIAPFYVASNLSSGEDQIVAYQFSNIGNTTKYAGVGFHHLNFTGDNFRTGSVRVYPNNTTINQSSMRFAVLDGGSLVETLVITGTIAEATSTSASPTLGVFRNKNLGITAGDNIGTVSFYTTTATFSNKFEAGSVNLEAIGRAGLTGANCRMSLNVNNGSGLVNALRLNSDNTLIVAPGSANLSLFLSADTSAGGNGARWHYNGSDIYFDAKGTVAPAFYFRSDTTAGATTRATISNAGRITSGAELAATTVNAIGATIAYWSGANILGIFASDRRSKNSIEPIDNIELDELWNTMRPIKYFFNIDANNPTNPDTGKKRKYYGFVANDLDSRIQMENRNVKIQMCRKCQMDCFHDIKCECEEYNRLECECLPEWTTNIRNYSERDMIAILTAKVKQQEKVIDKLKEDLVKERVQYKTMEDKQNKRISSLEGKFTTLLSKLSVMGIKI